MSIVNRIISQHRAGETIVYLYPEEFEELASTLTKQAHAQRQQVINSSARPDLVPDVPRGGIKVLPGEYFGGVRLGMKL